MLCVQRQDQANTLALVILAMRVMAKLVKKRILVYPLHLVIHNMVSVLKQDLALSNALVTQDLRVMVLVVKRSILA
jgi:hypothetical protein